MRFSFLKRRAAKMALAAALVISSLPNSGCSLSFSADTLLVPPKLTEEQTNIYNALTESAGKVDLRYPRTGEYRSAFVVNNLDEEYSNEAVVFYETKGAADTSSGTLRIGFLDKDEKGNWRSVYEIPAEGTEIESVSFSNLGGNKPRLIISFSVLNSTEKILSVIDYADGVATVLTGIVCTTFMIEELTRSGKEDLLCFARDKETKTAVFIAYGCGENGDFSKIYNTVQLSNDISEYARINIGKCLSAGVEKSCVAIDYLKSDNMYGTDMVYFTGNNFATAETFVRDNAQLSGYTRRTNSYTPAVFSMDIDGDGILDVPVTSVMPGYENLTYPEQLNAVSWYKQNSDYIEKVCYTFIDPSKNYMLIFPRRWEGMVTANVDSAENGVTFLKAAAMNAEEPSSALLGIRSIVKNSDFNEKLRQNAEDDGYALFYEDGEKLIFVKNITNDDMSLTQDELSTSLKIRPENYDS